MLFNHHDAYVGRSLALYGEYGPLEAALFAQIVKPGMWVVEAGANIGAHTVHLSRLAGDTGRVIAFEPQRLTFQTLCANVALNSRTMSTPIRSASARGRARPARRWWIRRWTSISAPSSWKGPTPARRRWQRVPIRSRDSFSLPACHFIKIDVEGMELAALARRA